MSTIIEDLSRSRAALLATIEGLDEAALDRKGVVGEWSVKNVLAHLAGWEEWVVRVLDGATPREPLPEDLRSALDDFDRFNAASVAEREEYTPVEQLMELERLREALLEAIDRCGDLDAPQVWLGRERPIARLVRIVVDHDREHLEEIEAALGRGSGT